MKQMARGAMAVLALIGVSSACVTDPQSRINNDDFKTLQAYPEVAFLKAAPDSSAVYFRLINDFGYGTPTHLTLKGVTGTIRVRQDTLFRAYYTNGDPNPSPEDSAAVPYLDGHLQRWWVFTNNVSGEGTFTLEASNGVETTVRIRVEAANLGVLPTQTAVAGQIVTLTAPTGEAFTQDAQVTYLRGATPAGFPTATDVARAGVVTSAGQVTSVSPDGKTLTFRAATDITGILTVTKAYPVFSGLSTAITSASPIPLSTLDTFHVAGLGTVHTVDHSYGFATDTLTTTGGGAFIGATAVTTANPGDVVNLKLGGFPGSLGTTAGTVPLAFLANTRVFIGGVEAGIVFTAVNPAVASIGADSNSVNILVPAHISPPAGKATVPITLTTVALNFDPTYLFGVAAVATTATQTGNPGIVKVGTLTGTGDVVPVTNYAGTGSRATAVQLPNLPFFPTTAANSRAVMINDAGAFTALGTGDCQTANFPVVGTLTIVGCKFYKLATEATRTIEAEIRWNAAASANVGVYAVPATGAASVAIKAAVTAGTVTAGGQPANNTGTSVTSANGQYIAVVLYSGSTAPTYTQLRLTIR